MLTKCAKCWKKNVDLKRCAKCYQVAYCSQLVIVISRFTYYKLARDVF